MKAIILAAGAGKRLGLTTPKSMLEVGGISIIHRQLSAFRAIGIQEFVIVVGYAQHQLRAHLADQPGTFTFIVNERYAETNTIYSLYLARHEMEDTFYYANADVVFDVRLTERLHRAPTANVLAVRVGPCDEEEVKVIVHQGRIVRISKKLDPDACCGEFLGVAKFAKELLPAFRQTLTNLIETAHVVNDYFEKAVDDMCDDWILVPTDVTDLPCCEIDFPEDLAFAQTHLAPRLQP